MNTETHQRTAELIEKLRQSGLRVTPQRCEIIRIMLTQPTHPSADAVFRLARETHPAISLATVYTTLDMLARLGAVQEVGGGGERRFDGHNPHPHAHRLCRKCGCVRDMPLPPQWEGLCGQDAEEDFQAESLQVTLVGLCPACRNAAE